MKRKMIYNGQDKAARQAAIEHNDRVEVLDGVAMAIEAHQLAREADAGLWIVVATPTAGLTGQAYQYVAGQPYPDHVEAGSYPFATVLRLQRNADLSTASTFTHRKGADDLARHFSAGAETWTATKWHTYKIEDLSDAAMKMRAHFAELEGEGD